MGEVEVIKGSSRIDRRNSRQLKKKLRVAAYCRVSTDSEDQKNSYNSQVKHYKAFISQNPEWSFVDIYADEAITGTQVTKRKDFKRLINDCLQGEIDMVITKSISRFARNTLDTLKYVRMLKEKNVAVFFEEENINTLTMDGELLLVILSSVAQQEVENISANVKKGLKMKMQRGELVGFQGCLGYDYHKESRSISVNEEEAEIVRYIFDRYVEGAGAAVISHELEERGYKTKRGNSEWTQSTIIGIIKNEKYKGDLLMGKTFTVDPISKRRLDNLGEEDQYYIRNHHDAIISEEQFDKAQAILQRRAAPRKPVEGFKRDKFSRQYAFSCMMECGFCGSTLTRRSWHSGSQYNKVIWQCVSATKGGKKSCEHSKGIEEKAIESAFVASYSSLCKDKKSVLDDFLVKAEAELMAESSDAEFNMLKHQIQTQEKKKQRLLDMRLDDKLSPEEYERKYQEISLQLAKLRKQLHDIEASENSKAQLKKRIGEFKTVLEQNVLLENFDRSIFESIVEKVIVGGVDEDGNIDPYLLTFIYKSGYNDSINGGGFKSPRKNAKKSSSSDFLSTYSQNEVDKLSLDNSPDTCGDVRPIGPPKVDRVFHRRIFSTEQQLYGEASCQCDIP